jgi:hypothetical protein
MSGDPAIVWFDGDGPLTHIGWEVPQPRRRDGSGLPVLPGFAIPAELESKILDAYGKLGDRLGTATPRVTVAGTR